MTEIPLVRVTMREFAFGMPDTFPAGLTRVRIVNDGGFWHHALFVKLDSTQSTMGYLAAIRRDEEFPPGATDFGGPPLTAAGDSMDHVLTFTPGRWLAMCTASGGGQWHVAMGMIDSFVVTSTPSATPQRSEPSAKLTLVMRDDTFEFPDTVTAGTQWVRIENRGRRWHECDVLSLEPGGTLEDYRRWRRVDHQMTPAPSRPVGGTADFGPGVVQWSQMKLSPGRLILVCDMPGDSTHYRYATVVPAAH